ncbi:hypothetical protein ACEXQE_01575 [Herbiconiux sp. P17]|uniref:hypothetical protein n=1 Tax=Herbiconiux wuyangfengii TaxID=3342794 RepID=UPI0035BB7B3B
MLWAGSAAGLDQEGRSAAYVLELGETSVSAPFPGWFYGVPVLVVLALSALVTVVGVVRSTGASSTRALLSVGVGMTAFTLGALWLFIARAGGLGAQFVGPGGDLIELTSPLEPLQIPLNAVGLLLCGAGVGLAAVAAVIRVPIAAPWRRMGRTNEE